MAEAPATIDAPSASTDGLDAAIAEMEQSISAAQQTLTSADPAPSSQAVAPTEQPAATTAQEPGGDSDTDEDTETSTEAGKPTSRMGRLRQQLTAADQRSRQLQEQLQATQQQQQQALREFVDLVLPDAQLETLRLQAESGDWDAKQRLDQARTWRRMVAPIADLAHRAAKQQFDAELAELRTLDGMDGDNHHRLLTAQTPGEQLRLMHQVAFKAADAQHKERIASLEAEVQALKTTRAANGSQPANGGVPGAGATGLAGLIDPKTGLLTDEAERLTPREIEARFGRAS